MLKNTGYKKGLNKNIIAGAAIAAVSILVLASLIFWRPRFFSAGIFYAQRAKNTFSYYILQNKPHFYYLQMEKNGKDIQVGADDPFEISYRDEFVIKAVVSDDLSGKYTTATIEGTGKDGNYIGVLLRGIDLVNNIMQSKTMAKGEPSVNHYKFAVYHQKEQMAVVPIRVVITPQDWLRFTQGSSNINLQIEYLKKAIAHNREDVGVRKILAGIYLRQNRIDEASGLYEDILRIQPNDAATMKELARCYLKSQRYDKAIELLSNRAKTPTPDAEVHALLGL
jgi:tetratricopeptide (TPR) repeat protein